MTPPLKKIKHTAGLLFSGGQDSATCLAWALETFDHVQTIGFEYGQRHDVEMTCRMDVRRSVQNEFPQCDDSQGIRLNVPVSIVT